MRRSSDDKSASHSVPEGHAGAPAGLTHAHVTRVAPGYLFIGLLAVLAGLLLGSLSARPPEPKGVTAAPEEFSAARAMELMLRLLGDSQPHPVGTPANDALRERLMAELEALGLEVTTQEAFACRERWLVCGHVVNVMSRLPGASEGPAVMLTAHYDSVGAGPGVSDDLAGVAAIVETARQLLIEGPLRNPIILLFTDGEEAGLLGAEAFALHPWLADVGVVVNLEARGSAGQSILFETSEDNAWLISAFAGRAPRPVTNSLLYELYRLLPNDTDLSVYKEAGLPGINFAYTDDVAHYHTPLDDLEHIDRGSLQHHGDNALAAARAFGALDLSDPPDGNSIYLDLWPGGVAQLPAGWAVPLALAGLLSWLVLVVVLLRRRLLDWPALGLGALAGVLALALAAGLGYAVVEALASLTGRDAFYYARPLPTRAAVWLAALLGTLLAAVPLARRAGFWGLSAGVWLLWGVATLATAVALPGASVFFLVPLLASATVYALVVLTGSWRSVWAAPAAAALAAFVTAYLWLPLVLGLESGLGLELAPAIAFCVALALLAFAPLVAQPPGQARGRAALLLTAVLGIGMTGTLAARAPNFTEQRPQRLSLLHLQEASAGETTGAQWLIDAYPGPASMAELAAVEPFARNDTLRLPWSGARYLAAPGPALDSPAPIATVVADASAGGGRVLTLELSSPRAAPRLSLVVPRGAGLERIVLPGTPYALPVEAGSSEGSSEDAVVFTCHGPACDGTTLELHLSADAGAAPLALTVADLSYGLPAEAAALLDARPSNAVPSHDGDVSVVVNEVIVPGP